MNIILISLDSVRKDILYDNTTSLPNINNLTDNCLLFHNAITQTPWTLPSHVSLFTGLYPFNHKIQRPDKNKIDPKIKTIFDILMDNKVTTYTFSNDIGTLKHIHKYGFRNNFKNVGTDTLRDIKPIIKTIKDDSFLFIHYWGTHLPYLTKVYPRNYRESISNFLTWLKYTRGDKLRAMRFIPQQDGFNRTMQVVSMTVSMDEHSKQRVKEGYFRAIQVADRFIGRITKLLKKRGIFEDTVFIILSDHGEGFNDNDELKETAYFTHGHFLYDYVINVPLIISSAKLFPGTKDIHGQVELIDILPTICDLFGIDSLDVDYTLDGSSIMKQINHQKFKELGYSETYFSFIPKQCLRSNDFKYIKYLNADYEYFFDLLADSDEQSNIITADRKEEFSKKLESFIRSNKQEFKDVFLEEEEADQISRRLRNLGYEW